MLRAACLTCIVDARCLCLHTRPFLSAVVSHVVTKFIVSAMGCRWCRSPSSRPSATSLVAKEGTARTGRCIKTMRKKTLELSLPPNHCCAHRHCQLGRVPSLPPPPLWPKGIGRKLGSSGYGLVGGGGEGGKRRSEEKRLQGIYSPPSPPPATIVSYSGFDIIGKLLRLVT